MGKVLRAIVIIISTIIILQSLGYPLTALLTFGGASSLIVGFAAKETISNFFGGLMVYLDRPFKVGDLIKTNSNQLEGVIEKIGWRSTRIRNLEKRPVYVPNSIWVTAPVENITRMSNRRVKEIFGIRYKDADKITVILNEIEDELRKHQEVDQKQNIIVRLHDFGASSLNIMLYFFTKTTNLKEFLTIKQEILLKIIAILRKHNADFAFPTTTVELPDYFPKQ
jgi:MscS family membrane protein